jgi:hypothetical protein
MAKLDSTTINDTGYLALPVGTQAQRVATQSGTLVYFTTPGTTSWTVPANVENVEVLIVGGGGGGGNDMGGGGGGGGVVYLPAYNVTPGASISVVVGAGGAGAPAGTSGPSGSNGQSSEFDGITAYGGGGGASDHDNSIYPAGDGASGGGASGGALPPSGGTGGGGYGGSSRGRAIYGGQGHDGAWSEIGYWYPGGGGGAGSQGRSNPAHGGDGAACDITGTVLFWGGGGGGSGYSGPGGNGGIGGGGGGAVGTTFGGIGYNNGSNGGGGGTGTWAQTPGGNGGANTGGGGGGGSHYNAGNNGGTGGSGIVIVKYSTTSKDTYPTSGAIRINSDTGAAEYYSSEGNWTSMAVPFKARTVITHAYMIGGYKDSSAWNNVNRTTVATDTTINLGDGSVERSFNYQSGACSRDIGYVFGAGNGHAISSNYIIAFNMRTEQNYTGLQSRTLSENGLNTGTIFKEHYTAWNIGGGRGNLTKFNLINEVIVQTTAGWSSTAQWGMSWENEGLMYWENDSRLFNFVTESNTTWSGTQPSNHHQQKAVQSKLNYAWAGNEGSYSGGTNLRRTNFVTRTTAGTYAKPRANCGEENFTLGQDWQYMLGNYDGAQNNGSWKWYYYTETGVNTSSTTEPKGKAGSSSGHCVWRD